jgi:hypothetical protein
MTRKSERSRTFTIFHNNKRVIIPRKITNDKILKGGVMVFFPKKYSDSQCC